MHAIYLPLHAPRPRRHRRIGGVVPPAVFILALVLSALTFALGYLVGYASGSCDTLRGGK